LHARVRLSFAAAYTPDDARGLAPEVSNSSIELLSKHYGN
jgi:hypothetical protein